MSMEPLGYGHFLSKFDRLMSQISEKDKDLLNKVENILLKNQQWVTDPQQRKSIKTRLCPLKIQVVKSRNNPQDRWLTYKILSLVSNPKTVPSDALCHWKDSSFSKWEIKQFYRALLVDPEFNAGYRFVPVQGNLNSYLGRGREGIVYLAEENLTGKLVAIKAKCEKQPDIHPYDGEEEVGAAGLFHQATGYAFEAKNFSNFNAKSYIAGRNLEDLLRSNDLFNGSEESAKTLEKLKELFSRLIQAKLFFADVAPENFVYDGDKFYIIDLRPVKVCPSVEEARREYTQELLDKGDDGISWTQSRWYHPDCKANDKAQFIKFMTNVLKDAF